MMQLMLRHAFSTAEQMRGAGLNEQMIRWVENSRPQLQERMMQQDQFRTAMAHGGAPPPVAQQTFQHGNPTFGGEGHNQAAHQMGEQHLNNGQPGQDMHQTQSGAAFGGMAPSNGMPQLAAPANGMQGAGGQRGVPTEAQVQTAMQFVARVKREYGMSRGQ